MQPAGVVADGESLTIESLIAVARHDAPVSLTDNPEVLRVIGDSRKFYIESGILAYGDNMGVGANVGKILPKDKRLEFQVRLTDALACGMGRELEPEISRGAMLLRANAFVKKGCSGIGLDKIHKIIELLNAGVVPVIYEDGSVCASGDLVPLASIAQIVQGRGDVWFNGKVRPAAEVFGELGIEKLTLFEKEGLAIVNGTSASTAMAALAVYDAEYLVQLSMLAEALAIEALGGLTDHLDAFVHDVKNHPGQRAAAKTLRSHLEGSSLTRNIDEMRAKVAVTASAAASGSNHVVETDIELQDPYCLRCSSQVFGPTLELLSSVIRPWIEREMNSANDNPIVNLTERRVHHTGNFSGFYVSLGMDMLKLAMFNIADLLHALKARLLNEKYNRGLGASLAGREPGFNSGFKGLDIATTDLFGKICFLTNPMSIHRRVTESYNQDVVSFGFAASRQALRINEEFRRLLAALLIILAQAVDNRCGGDGTAAQKLAPSTKFVYDQVRSRVAYLVDDRPMRNDLQRMSEALRKREITVG